MSVIINLTSRIFGRA